VHIKKRWEKIDSYGIEAQNFDTTRNLGINYIPCCAIVLMLPTEKYKNSSGLNARTNRMKTELNKYY
jgi:hypothetical protein